MKTDKVSFGTKPMVGYTRAVNGLPKYSRKLTLGILDAFEKLSKNGIDDELFLGIEPRRGAKKITTDVLELGYWPSKNNFQSSAAFSPKSLEKRSAKEISDFIISAYEKLKKSNSKSVLGGGYPTGTPAKIRFGHEAKISELIHKYGCDDWSCA